MQSGSLRTSSKGLSTPTAILIAIFIGVFAIAGFSLFSQGETSSPTGYITAQLHSSLGNGATEIILTVQNNAQTESFCRGVVYVRKDADGKLLKELHKDAGILNPSEERTLKMYVVVPEGSSYQTDVECVPVSG